MKLQCSDITLKLPKRSFAVPQINVFGHIVSAKGIQPDNAKIKAVKNAPTLRIDRGPIIPWLDQLLFVLHSRLQAAPPLRQLTKANNPLQWLAEHETAFHNLEHVLISSLVLDHYSLDAKTRVVVDASPWTVGAVLLQEQTDNSYRP